MADLTPSRIEPLGGSHDNQSENPNRKHDAKEKPARAGTATPPIDLEKEEPHQLDEQA